MPAAIIVIVALLLCIASATARRTASISLVHHNIASGGQPQAAADHIVHLLTLTPQKALVLLNEANYARQHFKLPYTDWNHIWKASPHEGRGNAIFTRDAVATLQNSWVMEMTEDWTHNQPKDPRVYPVVKVQLVSAPWVQFHCATVHFPTVRTGNAPARQESVDRLIQLSQNNPGFPLIICGDFNMDADEARTRIANPIGGRLYSNANVDHIIVRDSADVAFDPDVGVTRMGMFISDHPALRYNVTFRETNSAVNDWALY